MAALSVGLPTKSSSAMPIGRANQSKKAEKAPDKGRIRRIFRLPERERTKTPASKSADPVGLRRRSGKRMRGILRGSVQIRWGNHQPTTAHADVSFSIKGDKVDTKIELTPRDAPYPAFHDLDPQWDGTPEPALAATFSGKIVSEYADQKHTVLKVDYGEDLTPLAARRLGELGFSSTDFSKTRSTGEVFYQTSSGKATLYIETELVLKNQGRTRLGKGLRAVRDVIVGRRVVITESYSVAETRE